MTFSKVVPKKKQTAEKLVKVRKTKEVIIIVSSFFVFIFPYHCNRKGGKGKGGPIAYWPLGR